MDEVIQHLMDSERYDLVAIVKALLDEIGYDEDYDPAEDEAKETKDKLEYHEGNCPPEEIIPAVYMDDKGTTFLYLK